MTFERFIQGLDVSDAPRVVWVFGTPVLPDVSVTETLRRHVMASDVLLCLLQILSSALAEVGR